MSRFTFCNCPAGFDAEPERHAPDCPGRSGAGKARTPVPATKAITDDQRIAVLENAYVRAGEREHALRVELHAAKQKLAERDALLGRIYGASEWVRDAAHYQEVVQKLAYDALSASAEPSATVERDDRADFEQAFVVQDGVFFSAERNEYRSMNGRSIEYTDATDLNLRLQGWQARAALDKATEGASHE